MYKYNYSDLPVFDIVFGTFRNPQGYEMEAGFYGGASARIIDMLLCKGVSEEEQEPAEPAPVSNAEQGVEHAP